MFSKQTSHQLQLCMQSNALSLSRRNALICFIWPLRNPPPPPKKTQFNKSCSLLLSNSLEDNLSWLLKLYSIRFHSIHELKSLIQLQPAHPQLSCIQTLKKSKCSSDEAAHLPSQQLLTLPECQTNRDGLPCGTFGWIIKPWIHCWSSAATGVEAVAPWSPSAPTQDHFNKKTTVKRCNLLACCSFPRVLPPIPQTIEPSLTPPPPGSRLDM